MKFEDITLSEISQSQDKYCMFVLTLRPKITKLTESESRMGVCRGLGRGKWGVANQWA